MITDFDEVLDELGHFGRYQQITYFLFFFPIFLVSAYTLAFAFTASDPEYRCLIPECENRTSSPVFSPPWLENAVPMTAAGRPSECTRYAMAANWTDESCPAADFIKNVTLQCDEFVFGGQEVNIVNEFNLTCLENKWKLTLVGTMNFVGQFVGLPISGLLTDRFGRRTVMVSTMVLCSIVGFSKSFSPNYPTFVGMEFTEALIGGCVFPVAFVLALELVGPTRRAAGGVIVNVTYSVGSAYLALIAWALPNWRKMVLALYTPGLIFISYLWLVPESVRWLMSRGRYKEAGDIVMKAASRNGVVLSERVQSLFCTDQGPRRTSITENKPVDFDDEKQSSRLTSRMKEVLSSKILIFRLAVNCCCWMIVTMVYYGLSIGSVTLFGSKYLNFAMVSLVETPATILIWPMMEYLGRRYSVMITFILAGVTCIVVPYLPSGVGYTWVPIFAYLLGKTFITGAFNILYVYSSEMFPTALRSTMLSTCSTFGRIGSMIAPQAPLMAIYDPNLPYIVFGIAGMIAGCLAFVLPETLGARLPETVKEAEMLGRKKTLTTLR